MAKKKSKKSKIAKKTLVTLLLDRSYSMLGRKDATLEAISSFMTELKEKSENVRFSLVQFDTHAGGVQLEKTMEAVDIKEAKPLTHEDYHPRGSTPLIEAACLTIQAISDAVKGRKDIQVVVAIQTDGDENTSSSDYTWNGLRALIKEKEALGWQFNFMGAGINAYDQGAKMGISRDKTISYSDDRVATRAAFAASAANTALYSTGHLADVSYSACQKAAAGDIFDKGDNEGSKVATSRFDGAHDFLASPADGPFFARMPEQPWISGGGITPDLKSRLGDFPGLGTAAYPSAGIGNRTTSRLTFEVGDGEVERR